MHHIDQTSCQGQSSDQRNRLDQEHPRYKTAQMCYWRYLQNHEMQSMANVMDPLELIYGKES